MDMRMDSSCNSLAHSSFFTSHIFFFCLLCVLNVFWVSVGATLKVCSHTAKGNTYKSTDVSINKATSNQNQKTWVRFQIQLAVLKFSAHCRPALALASAPHTNPTSVCSLWGPGPPCSSCSALLACWERFPRFLLPFSSTPAVRRTTLRMTWEKWVKSCLLVMI